MKNNWDRHWSRASNSVFGGFLTLYRKAIIANAVKHYAEKFFRPQGIFLECGSGTSQASGTITKKARTLVAVDFSLPALRKAVKVPVIDKALCADIMSLPFRSGSIDGIWNLGVMAHFSRQEIARALAEFARVLKPGSYAVLFWPPKAGHCHLIITLIESFSRNVLGKEIDLFPDEITLYSRHLNIEGIARRCGFYECRAEYTARDLFTYAVVICRKR